MASQFTVKSSRYGFDSVAASPGVSLERGNYRMRAPNTRPLPTLFQGQITAAPRPNPRQHRMDPHLVFLLILLTVGCLSCFSTAYYLFSTRWATRAAISSLGLANSNLQVIDSERSTCTSNTSAKYLAYLPHSGFHNQRIAFENALLLANALRRTLLVPPIRLGNKPIRYVEYNTLQQYNELSDKKGLEHCSQVSPYISLPSECLHYFESTYLPWTWLVDLSAVTARQTLCHLPSMSRSRIGATLSIDPSEIYTLQDNEPYQYRFVDTAHKSKNRGKYHEDIYISQLATVNARLLQIGTLFGSSRLHLENSDNLAYRSTVRRSMVFANKKLTEVAASIAQVLGQNFISLHLRSGDGLFQSKIVHTANTTWWKIVHDTIGLSISVVCDLEARYGFGPSSSCTSESTHPENTSLRNTSSLVYPLRTASSMGLECRKNRHTEQLYMPLNIPLYVATDLRAPSVHPQLTLFQLTFPCIFFLGDFELQLRPLRHLISAYDGVNIYDFSLPFVDALVAGKAQKVVGTEGSTFSKFVEDVLWASSHEEASR